MFRRTTVSNINQTFFSFLFFISFFFFKINFKLIVKNSGGGVISHGLQGDSEGPSSWRNSEDVASGEGPAFLTQEAAAGADSTTTTSGSGGSISSSPESGFPSTITYDVAIKTGEINGVKDEYYYRSVTFWWESNGRSGTKTFQVAVKVIENNNMLTFPFSIEETVVSGTTKEIPVFVFNIGDRLYFPWVDNVKSPTSDFVTMKGDKVGLPCIIKDQDTLTLNTATPNYITESSNSICYQGTVGSESATGVLVTPLENSWTLTLKSDTPANSEAAGAAIYTRTIGESVWDESTAKLKSAIKWKYTFVVTGGDLGISATQAVGTVVQQGNQRGILSLELANNAGTLVIESEQGTIFDAEATCIPATTNADCTAISTPTNQGSCDPQSLGTCAGGGDTKCTSVVEGLEATCTTTMDDTAGGTTPCAWTLTNKCTYSAPKALIVGTKTILATKLASVSRDDVEVKIYDISGAAPLLVSKEWKIGGTVISSGATATATSKIVSVTSTGAVSTLKCRVKTGTFVANTETMIGSTTIAAAVVTGVTSSLSTTKELQAVLTCATNAAEDASPYKLALREYQRIIVVLDGNRPSRKQPYTTTMLVRGVKQKQGAETDDTVLVDQARVPISMTVTAGPVSARKSTMEYKIASSPYSNSETCYIDCVASIPSYDTMLAADKAAFGWSWAQRAQNVVYRNCFTNKKITEYMGVSFLIFFLFLFCVY